MDLTVSKIPMEAELHLQHVGASLLVVRRQEEGQNAGQQEGQGNGHLLRVMKYQGQNQTDIFAKELRFSPDMFDDHMPWGYSSLFQGKLLILMILYVSLEVMGISTIQDKKLSWMSWKEWLEVITPWD